MTYPQLDDPGAWMRQADAARLRGVKPQSIASMVERGRYRSKVVDGEKLVLREDVENYVPSKGGRPRKRQGT